MMRRVKAAEEPTILSIPQPDIALVQFLLRMWQDMQNYLAIVKRALAAHQSTAKVLIRTMDLSVT